MAFGWSFQNDNNFTVFDESYSTLTIIQDRTSKTINAGSDTDDQSIPSTSSTTNQIAWTPGDLIFARSTSPVGAFIGCSLWAETGQNKMTLHAPGSSGSVTVEYVVCRKLNSVITTPPTSGYGLCVMDSAGSLVWDSNRQYVAIVGTSQLNYSSIATTAAATTLTMPTLKTGTNRFILVNNLVTHKQIPNGKNEDFYVVGGAVLSTGDVKFGSGKIGSIANSYATWSYTSSAQPVGLIADIALP